MSAPSKIQEAVEFEKMPEPSKEVEASKKKAVDITNSFINLLLQSWKVGNFNDDDPSNDIPDDALDSLKTKYGITNNQVKVINPFYRKKKGKNKGALKRKIQFGSLLTTTKNKIKKLERGNKEQFDELINSMKPPLPHQKESTSFQQPDLNHAFLNHALQKKMKKQIKKTINI